MFVPMPSAVAGTFVDTSSIYAFAAFPQNFLTNVRPGDQVEMVLDAYPGTIFRGRVDTVPISVPTATCWRWFGITMSHLRCGDKSRQMASSIKSALLHSSRASAIGNSFWLSTLLMVARREKAGSRCDGSSSR